MNLRVTFETAAAALETMSAQPNLKTTAAGAPPQQHMTLLQLQEHLEQQQALQLAQNPGLQVALDRRAARRRDGVLGEQAAREWCRRIDNTPGGMAAFLATLRKPQQC